MAKVRLDNPTKTFGHVTTAEDVGFETFDEEFLVTSGSDGYGETTILYLIAGFSVA